MMSLANIANSAPSEGRPPHRLRIWRALSFLALVWAIAGAFWLLSWGQIWLVDRVVRSDWVPGWMTASTVKSADCSAVVEGVPKGLPDVASLKRARRATFEMGFALGATTALRNAGQVDTELNRQARSAHASELGVPVPEMPRLQSPSYALSEFRAHVVRDPQCIGALLAKLYSPRHDALYRFGALVGHEVIYLPQVGPIFVPELRQYGGAAGLPEEVWGLFIDPNSDARKALAGVNAYLQAEPAPQE